MSSRRIVESFEAWRRSGRPVVLATVYETQGSTYSKAGHSILIAADGDYEGLVSGGCLEGDLAEHARVAAATGRAATVTYDLRDEADELWGLGIGCNGLLRIILQPMNAAGEYAPFAAIAACMRAARPAAVATVVESTGTPALGATLVRAADLTSISDVPTDWQAPLAEGCAEVIASGRAACRVLRGGARVLFAPIKPIPRLLVLGAGLDAVPLVSLATALGWTVTVADHRAAYTARAGLESAVAVHTAEAARLTDVVDPNAFEAIVVMSHHLATDGAYLTQLVGTRVPYVGVLGPPARKRRLLASLGPAAAELAARLRGPVGLDIGADSPEAIALSIMAELEAVRAGRN